MNKLVLLFALVATACAFTLPELAASGGTDLANLNFKSIIGGPLMACIDAQAQAAFSTMVYLDTVGFETINGSKVLSTVTFHYDSVDASTGAITRLSISVPLITIVPIPFIQITEIFIELNVKISSVAKTTDSTGENTLASAVGGTPENALDMNVSVQSQSETTDGSTQQEFSLRVTVRGGQADTPPGLAKVLEIFEKLINDGSNGQAQTLQSLSQADTTTQTLLNLKQ